MTGRIHSIESMGAVDGPGVRMVVFLQGCAMRCRYCHNPDTWDRAMGVAVDSADIVRQAAHLRPFFGSGGGITLSGGEPLLQAEFAGAVFAGCHAEGIHTALDTSGCRFDDAVRNCLTETDLVLLDIKHTDPERHRELTGQPMDTTRAFLDHVGRGPMALCVRHVIVPGWTDSETELDALAEMLRPLPSLQRVELLPYHDMAEEKWLALGRPYPCAGLCPPSDERMAELRQHLAAQLPGRTIV